MIRDWLRLFRAQTAPATLLLVLTPYLTGKYEWFQPLLLGCFAILVHYFSFGHNSLMDTCIIPEVGREPYDVRDPAKKHHPLVNRRISLSQAKRVVLWGYCILFLLGILITLSWSPAPLYGVITFSSFVLFGIAYNEGLSKESLFGFLPISACFTALGAWGWFLSHDALTPLGWVLLGYFFFTILYQISWSGHLKDIGTGERGNLLVRLGAGVSGNYFWPGKARVWGWAVKLINLGLGVWIFLHQKAWWLVWWVGLCAVLILMLLVKQTRARHYDRGAELRAMSAMEVATIYLPVPLVLGWELAGSLMLLGIIYFVGMNKVLWGVGYPRV